DRAVALLDWLGAEIDLGRSELLDQAAENVGFDQRRNLVAEFELVENLLDVGREAVEVREKIVLKLLLLGAGPQIAEGEGGDVVKRAVSGGLRQRALLVGHARLVKLLVELEHRLLGRFEDRV